MPQNFSYRFNPLHHVVELGRPRKGIKQSTSEMKTSANRNIEPQALDSWRRGQQFANRNLQRAFPSTFSSIAWTSVKNRCLLPATFLLFARQYLVPLSCANSTEI